MKLVADYHMHSKYSGDCHNEIEDIFKRAVNLGLKEIAITDHGPKHDGYGIKAEAYPLIRAEINRLKPKYPEINVLLGLEANILGETGEIDITPEMLEINDWLNAGYHFASNFRKDFKIHLLNFLSPFSKKAYAKAKKINTNAMIGAMRQYDINMITHPGAKGPIDIEAVAKVAAETHTLLEINNQHGHLTTEEIKIAMQYEVNFAINSDAHRIEDIGVVDDSMKRVIESGLPIDRVVNVVRG